MSCTILIAISFALAATLCTCDPNILQGLPHGIKGIAAGPHHHHSGFVGDTFPGSIHGTTTGSRNDHFVFEPQQHSFQGVADFDSSSFLVGDDASSNLGKRLKQVFQGNSNGPIILGQPNQGGRVLSDGSGAFQSNQHVYQGTATSPIILGQPIQGGRILGDNAGTFQGNQQVFQGVQGNLQTGPNIFDSNVFGVGNAQQFAGKPMTVTVDRYVTTTDLVFNSLPVVFTNFVKRTVTRTTHHILPTPVNDVVHITTAVVSSTSTVTFTHVNTVFTCVTRTTVDLHPVTHTSYNIVPTTYTSIITKRLPVTSTIVHTNILTDTITVTDRQYITDYQYVTANVY